MGAMRRLAQRFGERMLLQLARRSAAAVGVVLVYHEIGAVAGDPRGELVPALSTRVFGEQLDHLATHYELIRLSELRARVQRVLASDGGILTSAGWFTTDWIDRVLDAAPQHFDRAFDRWRELYHTATRQLLEAQNALLRARSSAEQELGLEEFHALRGRGGVVSAPAAG